jgi:hypothetical protein
MSLRLYRRYCILAQRVYLLKIFGLGILIPFCTLSHLSREGDNVVALAANIIFYSSALTLYFYPSICAIGYAKQDRASVFKLNLFIGWTGLGWCLALYRALMLQAEDE